MTRFVWCALLLTGCSCGDDENECKNRSECSAHLACVSHQCVPCQENADCGAQGVCDADENGELGCYDPVVVRGRVFDLETNAGIAGALVVALDANASAVSDVAVSDAQGDYELAVPSLRTEEGGPVGAQITLRADAAGYQTFPSGIRQALPIDTTGAVPSAEADDHDLVVESSLTDIGLNALEAGAGTGSIHGNAAQSDAALFGTLVVAEVGGEGSSAVADRDGDYTIFNLAAGSYAVQGYARGVNYVAQTVELSDGQDLEVDLALSEDATATLNGNVSIVNGGDCVSTSVIMVVESTFDDVLARGDTPPGLRAPEPGIAATDADAISGAFSIDGVPAGHYVILAAFEDDFCVRDESDIGGTAIVHQEVTVGQTVDMTDSFKVTGALDVVGPGAEGPEAVTAPVTLSWEDDSSEDHYDVTVFDALGNVVWEAPGVVDSGGSAPIEVAYEGPLDAGMIYQFKAESIDGAGNELSQTEDLKGVFFLAPAGP